MCFQLWLLNISGLHQPCKANVIRFRCRVNFPYCQLKRDNIRSAVGTCSLMWMQAILHLANVRLKRSRTIKIWSVCTLRYFTGFFRFLKGKAVFNFRKLKFKWYLSIFLRSDIGTFAHISFELTLQEHYCQLENIYKKIFDTHLKINTIFMIIIIIYLSFLCISGTQKNSTKYGVADCSIFSLCWLGCSLQDYSRQPW
jgi:hypothetical protein